MNKVYKVVWSKVKNCYVVASELAKRRTKSPKSGLIGKAAVAGILACVLNCGSVMPVQAAPAYGTPIAASGTIEEDGFLVFNLSEGRTQYYKLDINGSTVWENYHDGHEA